MWDDGSAGGYEGGNYEIITDDDFLNALALPQFQVYVFFTPGSTIAKIISFVLIPNLQRVSSDVKTKSLRHSNAFAVRCNSFNFQKL